MSPERRSYEISLDEIVSNAKEILLRDGNHVPALIVEGSKKLIVAPIPNMPETHGERIVLLRFLGQAAVKTGSIGQLQQVFIITEGWLSVGIKEESSEVRPSQDPNRKEVLIISGMQIKERRKIMKLFEILRDDENQVISLEESLRDVEEKEVTVEIPLVEAFVRGFQTSFRSKYN